ncbi:MAG: DUF167 family protein, partial [Steroidobacteraceae bacterium]
STGGDSSDSCSRVAGADLILRLRVQPRASHPGLVGVEGDRLKLRIAAPPVEGAANRAVIEWLAERLALPRARLSLERGATGRNKDVRIAGGAAAAAQLLARLQAR